MKTTPQEDLLTTPSLAHSVAECCAVTWDQIVGASRAARYSTPRKILAYLIRKRTSLTLQDIGDMCGGRDHSTVLYWIRAIDREREDSPVMSKLIDTIEVRASEITQTYNEELAKANGSS